jgi:hypothetical protein
MGREPSIAGFGRRAALEGLNSPDRRGRELLGRRLPRPGCVENKRPFSSEEQRGLVHDHRIWKNGLTCPLGPGRGKRRPYNWRARKKSRPSPKSQEFQFKQGDPMACGANLNWDFADYNGFWGGDRYPPKEADIKRFWSQQSA